MELHQHVPADFWCLTFTEFLNFVAEVRELWGSEAGARGPDLYEVNELVVKPQTLAAGGMSYALWLHPSGLACQVFISHAWAEGIFEFGLGVQGAWPMGQGLTNLYCCLLSNPQNLDMETFLNVDPMQNPFAVALQRASHLLVIPNSKISIYSRLWCVRLGSNSSQIHPNSSSQGMRLIWARAYPRCVSCPQLPNPTAGRTPCFERCSCLVPLAFLSASCGAFASRQRGLMML